MKSNYLASTVYEVPAAGHSLPSEPTYAFPASFSQRRLWFLQQLEPNQTSYLVPMAWRMGGPLSVPAVVFALNRIAQRHDSLRTSFEVQNGEPVQVVAPYSPFDVAIEELGDAADRDAAASKWALLEANTPFDLSSGPLYRFRIFRFSPEDHVLLFTIHHIVFDGWSKGVWMGEFTAFYREYVSNEPAAVAELPIQYGDFAAWQQDELGGETLRDQLSFWNEALSGAPTLIDLPTDRPRPKALSPGGAKVAFTLDKTVTAGLRRIARETDSTLFMVMLSAFYVLLARYAGQEEVLVGTPIANRERLELEPLIGFFANSLVMRGSIKAGASFLDVLAESKRFAVEAYARQDIPFDKLVEELQPERSLGSNPLFQVMFAMQNIGRERFTLPDITINTISGGRLTAKLDLFVSIVDTKEALRGVLEYSVQLYDAATIERLASHYQRLLAELVENPEVDVTEVSFLSEDESKRLLVEWNRTRSDYPRDKCLHQLFEEQASLTPQSIAVAAGDNTVTYAQLNERANRLSHLLMSRGVGAGTLVGVCLGRSEELLVALLGILKTGAAYLPLDPAYPLERLDYILKDAKARLVVTERVVLDSLPVFDGEALCLDTLADQLDSSPAHNPDLAVDPEGLAYVLHTSGSTGKPKGVEITQRNLVNFLCSMRVEPGIASGDTLLAVTTLSFDISGLELYLPLLSGACVVIASREQAVDAVELMKLMHHHQVSIMQATPATWRMLLEAEWNGDPQLKVLCGGEAMPAELAEQLVPKCRELWNMYGPTETTIWSAVARIEAGAGQKITIGHPIANTQLHLLDANRKLVPIGVLGELYIGGEGVGRGYWGKPELTAERFVADPFAAKPDARMFRTGDMGRRLSDGRIDFLGRGDHQVKIRGFRIELGEIETVLARQPDVQQCVVVAREDIPGDKRLVAYVVANATGAAESGKAADESEEEQISRWATAWDESYRGGANVADATFNLAGWNSSYTGEAIPAEEMRVWVETTVDRILQLKAKRVWEIGCGTGLLLFRVAPHAEHYHGTDISETALGALETQVARPDIQLPQVTLACRPAHEGSGRPFEDKFDLVVLNSVIQYFPDADYLAQVLSRAVDSLDGAGAVFIGDVRNHALLNVFRTSVELFNAPPGLSHARLLQKIEKTVKQEEELVVDPEFFFALQRKVPRISRVEIQLKRGAKANELTKFRYDVTLHVGPPDHKIADVAWIDWTTQNFTLDLLRRLLDESQPNIVGLTRIPNAQLQFDVAATAMLNREDAPATAGALRDTLAATLPAESIQPELLLQEIGGLPYHLEMRPSRAGDGGYCDALLVRRDIGTTGNLPLVRFPGEPDTTRPWASYCNNPLQQNIARALVPKLREWLAERLPEYMVPSAMVVLDALPLSSNGKINRRALPCPDYAREEDVPYIAPRTEYEIQLAAIWSEALHVPQIGLADNFFSLGGHSLLGTQIVSRIRKIFQIELPLRSLFEAPTLEAFAATLEALSRKSGSQSHQQLTKADRTRPLPLSFAQQRFWFLDQLEPGSSFYNMPLRLRLSGKLNIAALESALSELVARHEILRTTFVLDGAEPIQLISPPHPAPLPVTDLTGVPEGEQEAQAHLLVGEELRHSFDLRTGPLFHPVLLKLADDHHVLVLNLHHIVSDGWSTSILRQELFTLYDSLSAGVASPLPALPFQYADYAAWQRSHVGGDALEQQLEYWKENLRNAPASIDLATDHPRPPVQTYRGSIRSVVMPKSLLDALKALGQREGTTLYMTLLAAFNVLLSRYSGQDDIVVGSAIAGRTHADTEKLIGLFVNTLALRTDLSGNPRFQELLRRVRTTTVNAYAHQDVPFERLVEELNPVRDSSRSPLYQVMVVLQNTPNEKSRAAGLDITGFGADNETSKMDMVLTLMEQPSGLRAALLYNTDLFDGATIERMLERFERLLDGIVQTPQARLASLPLLSDSERDWLLYGLNDTDAEFPIACIHELFERQADRVPDAAALHFAGGQMTYRELEESANRFAHYLRSLGVGPGAILGVCMERGFDLMTVLLGIFKSGAAYLALDPTYPAGRLSMMLEDGDVKLVVAHQATLERVPAGVEPMMMDLQRDAWQQKPADRLPTIVGPDDLAYVIHTSGSTGRPKGAMQHHGGMANFLFGMQKNHPMRPEDRFLSKTSLNFDASVWEIFWPLSVGAQVVIAPSETYVDVGKMIDLMAAQKVTYAFMVPSLLSTFTATPGVGRLAGTLRWVISGGEKVTVPAIVQFQQSLPGVELHQCYGPTEASITVVEWACRPDYEYTTAPLGRPVPNSKLYVLDEFKQPVPFGVPGELYIGGIPVGLGYLHRPDLTAERFLPNPFGPGRMYKTGDSVRYLPDGNLEFVGRLDFQIKLRGLRIELGEIESALRSYAQVRDCVVVAREDSPGEKRVVAYFVSQAGSNLDVIELRNHLKATLPEYMVPAAFVELEALPLSLNGKVDRKALPAPDMTSASGRAEGQPPQTQVEILLAGIWKDILKIPLIHVEDDFFQLGGHSLLATQMVTRARSQLNIELPLITIFSNTTLKSFAKAVERILSADGETTQISLGRIVRPARLPLSFAQQRFWFLAQLEPDSSFYNVNFKWRLHGVLDVAAIKAALNEILARHEVLRTTYVEDAGDPIQIIAPAEPIDLAVVDLSSAPDADLEEQVRGLASAAAQQAFDLQRGPMLRAKLFKLAPDRHVLVLSTHHIVMDGWSSGILRQELFTLYRAFAAGSPSPLAALPAQYADYATWQRTHLEGPALDRQLEYWKTQLRHAPPSINLTTDRTRPAEQTYRGSSRSVVLPKPVLDGLTTLGLQEGTTLFMTLLAAFNVLLSRYSGQDDIVVGSAIAGRTHSDAEKLIGPFVNTLVLRTDLSGNPTFQQLLGRVRATTVDAYANQDVPFERLVEELNPVRDSSRSPLYQVMMVLQNTPKDWTRDSGLEITGFDTANETSQMDILLNLVEQRDGLRATMLYNSDLFFDATIEHMLDCFVTELESVLATPESPISELSILSSVELNKVLCTFNDTHANFRDICLHELVAEQVVRTPGLTAVVDGTERFSFAELDRRANRVAHELIARGMEPDSLAGIYFDRSLDMLVAILGVLKSGGAYVPLDPSYPSERTAHILEAANAQIILSRDPVASSLPHGTPWMALSEADGQPDTAPETAVQPHHLAYVLFTSGSTGRPKGVAIEHRSVATFIQWALTAFTPDQLAGVLLSTSVCFDLSIFEIFAPLTCGGKIILSENALHLPTVPARDEVTLINTVPSAIAELVRSEGVPSNVRTINLAGEALTADLVEKIYSRTAVEQVFNLYGPTEDTTYSTYTLVRRGAAVTIGRPIANTQALILDAALQPQPIGVPGELYLAGAGLARGYLNRPDLTAERFLPHPFNPGERMYKTGDLCRWLPDGNLEYVGRLDHQVKVRGFRIELGEIESTLRGFPGLSECAVIAREDQPGDKRLVAYIVGAAGTTLNPVEVRSYLGKSLPAFMVPAAFVSLAALPQTPNGKIDRSALPAPSFSSSSTEGTPPRTHIEILVAEIWEAILNVSSIHIEDDFFQLGGHSLLAMQMVSRVRARLGIDLALIKIFSNSTLETFAQVVEAAISLDGPAAEASLASVVRPARVPLSFTQQRFWFLDQLEPGSSFYNISLKWRIAGALEKTVLAAAINEVISRHEILRTTYVMEDGEPVQRIAPSRSIDLTDVDLSTVAAAEREQQARRLVGGESRRSFDLENGPMLRATLFTLAEEDHILVLATHHIVTDGWSSGVLQQELFTLYEAFATGLPSPLAPLPVQYADYAVWQRTHVGEALEQQLAYWKEHLRNAPPSINLSTDRPRPAMQTYRGASRSVTLPKTLLEAIKALGQEQGTTLFMTLLAGFNVLLSRYSGQDDLVVGSAIAGRTHRETEKLIGLFVNTLALRTDLSCDPTFLELLGRIRTTTVNAYAHQDVPFERLVEEINPVRDSSRSPLYQVMMILQNTPRDRTRVSGLQVEGFGTDNDTAQMDLLLNVIEQSSGLKATMYYNTDLFDGTTIERMLASFVKELESAVAAPESRISELSIVSNFELETVLKSLNETWTDVPPTCLHHLFAEQAQRTPDATAIIHGEEKLSFAELDRRSNRVARELMARGVAPGTLVGIYFKRSADMLVAILGVLKAGGAYFPLDPNYPLERIAHILDDTGAALILSSASVASTLPDGTPWMALSEANGQTDTAPQVSVQPHDLAYVLHTSGSTGKPKGVEITHRNLTNFLLSMQKEPGLTAQDILLAVTTLSFDISGLELYLPLITGACVVIASREDALDSHQLMELMSRWHVSVMQATPATWKMLLDAGWSGDQRLKILCGGEALPQELAAKLVSRCRELWNMYGPTETTIWSSVSRIDSGNVNLITIGHPIANTRMYVLDSHLHLVPVGVAGELYIGGEGVARGYWRQPQLTAERFVADPFVPGARMYRTGDLARVLGNGSIQCLGRIDFQVKVRGHRIELGEIETVLKHHPAVSDCVVIAREDEPGDKRLAAYIVPVAGSESLPLDLRAHLVKSLPDYMVPTAFMLLSALPQTPNGKVDRNHLPVPASYNSAPSTGRSPRSRMETLLAEIWKEVLGVDSVNVEDDFFQLGGHSLLAAAMIRKLNESLGYRVPLAALFQAPTLGALAAAAQKQGPTQAQLGTIVPIRKTGTKPALFCVSRPNVNALGFIFLSRAVSKDLPIYGLQSNMENDGSIAPFTQKEYEEKASEYVQAMREVQPQGPYFLTGTCEGAHIAFEMARQLKAANLEVGILSVLDVWPLENTVDRKRFMLRNYQRAFRRFLQTRVRGPLARVKGTLSGNNTTKSVIVDGKHLRAPVPDLETKKFLRERLESRYWPGRGFKPTTYDGSILVFRVAKQPIQYIRDKNLGWQPRIRGEVDLVNVPGIHTLILREPAVSVVARELEARIDAYLAKRNASQPESSEP